MKPLAKRMIQVVAVAASVLFAAGVLHCVIECHNDGNGNECGCFCHLGVYDTSALEGVSFVLIPQSFIDVSSENTDSAPTNGVFRPPIA